MRLSLESRLFTGSNWDSHWVHKGSARVQNSLLKLTGTWVRTHRDLTGTQKYFTRTYLGSTEIFGLTRIQMDTKSQKDAKAQLELKRSSKGSRLKFIEAH